MNHWLDLIQIWPGGSLDISDDLINFEKNSLKTRWSTEDILNKTSHQISLWARYLMNHCLDRILCILCSGSPVISNDLIIFWEESIKNKLTDEGHFEKIATWKACGCDILWTVGWITFKYNAVVLQAFLMIWLTFGKNPLTTSCMSSDIYVV